MTAFQPRFNTLDRWLHDHALLWQFDTFLRLDTPWKAAFPDLAAYLEQVALTELHSERFYDDVFCLCPSLAVSRDWTRPALTPLPPKQEQTHLMPSYVANGIKGRKWAQIQAFVGHTPVAKQYLEWCAGKGHLGKLLAFEHGCPVHSLEWQKTLCDAGEQEAKRLKIAQTFTHANVLKHQGQAALQDTDCVVALHACGDLHRVLLEQAVDARTQQVCISPCCYHLTQDAEYQPLSTSAKQSALTLRQADLKLAVKEVATAGAREQRLKQLELTYRLGFDAWQRTARQQDHYLPVPSIQKAILTQGFTAFCHWAAEQKQLSALLNQVPCDGFESMGEQRYQHVQKLEAISQLFRPALEYWLVLDRALFLEENGYCVDIGPFCDKNLTPRNWMIRASLGTEQKLR
ncbi:methyltransferase [Marinomonas sp. IMCC 4694]|uniref:methyltransferase n=1 Tax=Marinomonas sp. IMCC 4694 TaxID=2605432 RepID=UPI0011E71585|nr:methyltransferase [Marinomonas sp. IMCC 4694]TYL47163.1 methyltransferase [Marinomonas sp. IMCC 4694]